MKMERAAYFWHPHCIYAGDPRRARLWYALLLDCPWMSTDEMIEICRRRGE